LRGALTARENAAPFSYRDINLCLQYLPLLKTKLVKNKATISCKIMRNKGNFFWQVVFVTAKFWCMAETSPYQKVKNIPLKNPYF